MTAIDQLLKIMEQLRDPERGCPWDREQRFDTVAPYTLEEAYEVDEAIRTGDMDDLRDELGDLLFQVVFHAQMAAEAGHFDFGDVVAGICEKLVRRHPHVFEDSAEGAEGDLGRAWEEHKQREREARAARRGQEQPDPFDGIPAALPALARASKLQKRWERLSGVEPSTRPALRAALEAVPASMTGAPAAQETDAARTAQQRLGALLFETVALARATGLDAETALREFNAAIEAEARRARVGAGPRGPT